MDLIKLCDDIKHKCKINTIDDTHDITLDEFLGEHNRVYTQVANVYSILIELNCKLIIFIDDIGDDFDKTVCAVNAIRSNIGSIIEDVAVKRFNLRLTSMSIGNVNLSNDFKKDNMQWIIRADIIDVNTTINNINTTIQTFCMKMDQLKEYMIAYENKQENQLQLYA